MDINDFRFHVIDSEDAVRLYSGEGYADLFKFCMNFGTKMIITAVSDTLYD